MNSDFSLDHLEPDEELPEPELHFFSSPVRKLAGCGARLDYLSSKQGKELEGDIWSLIEESGVDILSFDVFDTYLLRNNKPEALRYLELSQLVLDRLQEKYPKARRLKRFTADDLCQARIMGMQETYRTRPLVRGCGEGLIDEVISMQRAVLGLEKKAEQLLLEAEIDYEADNLAVNPVLSRIAARFRENGGRVVLISDMYLGAGVIGRIIQKLVNEPVHDYLFSSADLVISKRSGKIFPLVEKELDAGSDSFLHMGDAWIGDVLRPRAAGWKALYFPVSEHEKQERGQGLADFVSSMDARGIETRSWAKI